MTQRTKDQPAAAAIKADISVGELADKIGILEIKADRIDDPDKLSNVRRELDTLRTIYRSDVPESPALEALCSALKDVNVEIWNLEDDIREHERNKDFGASFVSLARSVYQTNDRRAALKREINVLVGSAIVEEKSYQDY